jgi:hypothetical protein
LGLGLGISDRVSESFPAGCPACRGAGGSGCGIEGIRWWPGDSEDAEEGWEAWGAGPRMDSGGPAEVSKKMARPGQ